MTVVLMAAVLVLVVAVALHATQHPAAPNQPLQAHWLDGFAVLDLRDPRRCTICHREQAAGELVEAPDGTALCGDVVGCAIAMSARLERERLSL